MEDEFLGGVVLFREFGDDLVHDDVVIVFEAAAGGVADKFTGHVSGEFVLAGHEEGFEFVGI